MVNIIKVKSAMGISTMVYANDSMKGWYIAVLDCLKTMGLCENSVGISAWAVRAANNRALMGGFSVVPGEHNSEYAQENNTTAGEESRCGIGELDEDSTDNDCL